MKRVSTLLVAALALGGLAACDTMNDMHQSLHVEDTTKDAKFTGINGDTASHCSPAQRHSRMCY